MAHLLEMKNICKSFSGVSVLKNNHLELEAGEVHALLGENGAGKSTLIKILGGVYTKDSGQILVDGQEVEITGVESAKEHGIRIIHQELMLIPDMTISENIFIGQEPKTKAGQEKMGIAYIFISHDLSVVEHISDEVGVMYLGNLVEKAPKEELFKNPKHPYTKALMSAIPIADPDVEESRERIMLTGDVPSPINTPIGCKFQGRCSKCMDICKKEAPLFKEVEKDHYVACHLYD